MGRLQGFTSPIGTNGTIQEMDYRGLVPGDLAVTTNGVHLLAYAGEGQWIQADPGIGSVVTLDGRTDFPFAAASICPDE